VIDRQTYARLQGIIRREGRSFLQYVDESFPWTTSAEQGMLAKLQRLAQEDREAVAALARLLIKNRLTPPYLGAFPTQFTNFNFLALPRLLEELVRAQAQSIGLLHQDLVQITDPGARAQLGHLLEMKKRHLGVLETLKQPEPRESGAA
jgi:hypothetical protein